MAGVGVQCGHGFFLHRAGTRKGQPFPADPDAVADGLIAFLNQIEKAPVRIDHDRSGRIRRAIIDDLLEELRIDAGVSTASTGNFSVASAA